MMDIENRPNEDSEWFLNKRVNFIKNRLFKMKQINQ